MSMIKPFQATDLLKINEVNIDPWTETYGARFYMQYFSTWPDFSCVVKDSQGEKIVGYAIGKHEPPAPHPEHHGHISALSVATSHRGLGIAKKLNNFLEQRSGPDGQDTWFLDLFVRCCNTRAIKMYEGMGYSVYRRVVGYYHGMGGNSPDDLDAFDMRKSMPKDTDHQHIRQNGRDFRVQPKDVWQ